MEIFQPGQRHVQEERDRKRTEASRPGKMADPLGVDLDAGIVRLPHLGRRPARPDAADDDPEPEDAAPEPR